MAEKTNNAAGKPAENATGKAGGEGAIPTNAAPGVVPKNEGPKTAPEGKILSPKGDGNDSKSDGVQTVTNPGSDTKSPPDASAWGFWDVFWVALVLAIFLWMWRTGKLLAIKTHVGETREELGKCTWPTWEELRQHIVVVLISSMLLAVFTVFADNVLREIVWGALMDSKTLLFKGSGE